MAVKTAAQSERSDETKPFFAVSSSISLAAKHGSRRADAATRRPKKPTKQTQFWL
jgi:hypothetical protein